MILVLHSPTITDYKSQFFLNFEDIKLMDFMLHNDATLLYKTNDDTKKVYEKNLPILTVIFLFSYYKFSYNNSSSIGVDCYN